MSRFVVVPLAAMLTFAAFAEESLDQARALIGKGQLEPAEKLLRKITESETEYSDAHDLLDHVLQRRDDMKGCADLLEGLQKKGKLPPTLVGRLAYVYYESGQFEKAEKAILEAEANHPDKSLLVMIWAKQPDKLPRMLKKYEDQLKADRTDIEALEILSSISLKLADHEKAAKYLEQLSRLRPERATELNLMGEYAELRQVDDVVAVAKRMQGRAKSESEKREIVEVLAHQISRCDRDRAIAWLNENYPLNGASAFELANVARTYSMLGCHEQAIKLLIKGFDCAENDEERMRCRDAEAFIEYRRENYGRAEELLKALAAEKDAPQEILIRSTDMLREIKQIREQQKSIEKPAQPKKRDTLL